MESFVTIQGEGPTTGYPTRFIRLQGCPFRCTWCDTKDSWPFKSENAQRLTIPEVLAQCEPWPFHICVTGGEPLAQQSGYDLCLALDAEGFQVSVETSGLMELRQSFFDEFGGRIIMDYKLPGSGEGNPNSQKWFNTLSNLRYLRRQDVVKFVVLHEADLMEMRSVVESFGASNATFYASPVHGQMGAEQLAKFVLDNELDVVVQIQLHKELNLP